MPKVRPVNDTVASAFDGAPQGEDSKPAVQDKQTPVPVGNDGFNLPSFLTADSTLPAIAVPDITGYTGFADARSKNWLAMKAAGINEGEGFLNDCNEYIRCVPLEFVVLAAASFRTKMVGSDMSLQFATEDMSDSEGDPHYVCLLAVKVGNKLVPALGEFRGTKSSAAEKAISAIRVAGTPEWAKLSDAHKVSCEFPRPFGRVWVSVTTSPHIGRSSGNKYYRSDPVVTPTNASQIRLMLDSFNDSEYVAKLNKANENFQNRCKLYRDKAGAVAKSA